MVHSEGTRSIYCRQPVRQVSSVLIDLAVEAELAIVPVRFVGGLPLPGESVAARRLEFPVGYGRQDYHIGSPISPEALRGHSLKQRQQIVLAALNSLGPSLEEETPSAPDVELAARVADLVEAGVAPPPQAVVIAALERDLHCGKELQELVRKIGEGEFNVSAPTENAWLNRFGQWLTSGETKSVP